MGNRIVTVFAASAALALTVIACERASDVGTYQEPLDTPVAGTTGVGAVRVADIHEHPEQFVDRTVTIEAEVDRVVGPQAFFLDEESPFQGGVDNDLLVLTRAVGDTTAAARADAQWIDERVRVTGTVRAMSVVEIEREVGWDLSPEIEVELEGIAAVIVADSVERLQR